MFSSTCLCYCGVAEPVSVFFDTKGTGVISDDTISEMIQKVVDLAPAGMIKRLDLKISIYGHFGRKEFSWEKLDLVDKFKKYKK